MTTPKELADTLAALDIALAALRAARDRVAFLPLDAGLFAHQQPTSTQPEQLQHAHAIAEQVQLDQAKRDVRAVRRAEEERERVQLEWQREPLTSPYWKAQTIKARVAECFRRATPAEIFTVPRVLSLLGNATSRQAVWSALSTLALSGTITRFAHGVYRAGGAQK